MALSKHHTVGTPLKYPCKLVTHFRIKKYFLTRFVKRTRNGDTSRGSEPSSRSGVVLSAAVTQLVRETAVFKHEGGSGQAVCRPPRRIGMKLPETSGVV